MSIHQYFEPVTNLPIPSQAKVSPNVLSEVNLAVKAVLENEEEGKQAKQGKKRNYVSFMPEDSATIGRYAADHPWYWKEHYKTIQNAIPRRRVWLVSSAIRNH